MSFSKNSRHYLLYTRAEFQPCHPVDQSITMYLKKSQVHNLTAHQNNSCWCNTVMLTRQQQWTPSIDSNDVTLNCTSPLCELYIKIHLKYEIQNANINDTTQRIPKVLLLNFTTVLVDFPLLLLYWTAEISLVLLQPAQNSWW